MAMSQSLATQIQAFARGNMLVGQVFQILRERSKSLKKTDLYRVKLALLRGGIHISNDELDGVFEKLHKLGVGKLRTAKLPNHSTFEWTHTMSDVIGLVVTTAEVAPTPSKERMARTAPNQAHPPRPTEASYIRVFCPLRDEVIPLTLPADFGPEDATQLAKFLAATARSNVNQ